MFLTEVAVALIGELTVLRRIQKEEAVGIILLLEDLLEARLQDRRPCEKLCVLGVVQFGPRNRLVASLRNIELTLLVLPKHPPLTRFALLLELASSLQIMGGGSASNGLLCLLVVGVVLHEGSDVAGFSCRHRPIQSHEVRMDIRKHPLRGLQVKEQRRSSRKRFHLGLELGNKVHKVLEFVTLASRPLDQRKHWLFLLRSHGIRFSRKS